MESRATAPLGGQLVVGCRARRQVEGDRLRPTGHARQGCTHYRHSTVRTSPYWNNCLKISFKMFLEKIGGKNRTLEKPPEMREKTQALCRGGGQWTPEPIQQACNNSPMRWEWGQLNNLRCRLETLPRSKPGTQDYGNLTKSPGIKAPEEASSQLTTQEHSV